MGIERPASWQAAIDETLRCIDVHAETHDVKTFTFVSDTGRRFEFRAGQYVTFDFPVAEGTGESRCYSISSSPHRQGAFTITVKRVAGGLVSNWLHDNLQPGGTIRARGPLGQFIRPEGEGRRYLFLSGGSGITPLMSMARDIADSGRGADIIFLHAARSPRDVIFRDELALLARRIKGFRLILLPEDIAEEPCWPGLTGRLSPALLSLVVPDLAQRTVLCCGPAPFMAAARGMATAAGVPAEHYLEESFDAATLDLPAPVVEAEAGQSFKVQFSKQARTIEVGAQQTVLASAKAAGVRIPSSCANGICGTCKSKLVSGKVDMQHSGGIRQREIDAGLFLPCCSKPLSDLVIER